MTTARNGGVAGALVAVLIAIVGAFLVQAYVVKPYSIPTPSMAGTLQPGDRVLVDRVLYHVRSPRRGDIVVFRYPKDRHIVFIKRVIGVPGDTLLARDGKVVVNGVALPEPYVRRTYGRQDPTRPAGRIPGASFSQPWALSQPFTVPDGQYFVLGDNRLHSSDSRAWGTVPAADIIGAGAVTYWPPARWRKL